MCHMNKPILSAQLPVFKKDRSTLQNTEPQMNIHIFLQSKWRTLQILEYDLNENNTAHQNNFKIFYTQISECHYIIHIYPLPSHQTVLILYFPPAYKFYKYVENRAQYLSNGAVRVYATKWCWHTLVCQVTAL
jgi:hypothetical protein